MAKIEIYNSKNIAGINSTAIWLSEYNSDKEGRIFLSPNLATAREIDYHIDKLIDDLNKSRSKAKKLMKKGK